jgi:hypothetical protein
LDGTGSGSCPWAGFGISRVEPFRSATRYVLISLMNTSRNKMDLNLNKSLKWSIKLVAYLAN